jgi:ubiquinone/menaquinone biosynthesis C-methylase UbiE
MTYQFDNSWEQTCARLGAVERRWNPSSIRHFERIGVKDGWRCWEVGAGVGSLAVWLSTHVAPSGSVLATDLDTRHLVSLEYPNLEVRQHNVCTDDLPKDKFDLIHTRLLLVHLPQRQKVLRRLITALAPGGTLLCEEHDWTSYEPTPETDPELRAIFQKYKDADTQSVVDAGLDRTYGRRLYRDFVELGLSDVDAEGVVRIEAGPGSGEEVFRLGIAQRRDRILATGLISEAELDRLLEARTNPQFALIIPTLWSVSGRRPSDR